jgi:hypothetical protein
MIPEDIARYLMYPFYRLYSLNDVSSFEGPSISELAAFARDYDPDLRAKIVESLQWVRDHPAADLTRVLPNLPCSNDAIHGYARELLQSLSKE